MYRLCKEGNDSLMTEMFVTTDTDLHDDTGHNVLEGLLQLGQAGQAGLHHPICPLIHLGVLITRGHESM